MQKIYVQELIADQLGSENLFKYGQTLFLKIFFAIRCSFTSPTKNMK